MANSIVTKSGVPEAPQDGNQYARKDGAWAETASEVVVDGTTITGTGITGDPLVAVVTEGPAGADGIDGTNGTDGDSAYQIWLDEGNTGTEQEFLDSLVGADGADGLLGVDLSQCRLEVLNDLSVTATSDVYYDISLTEDYNNDSTYFTISNSIVTINISGYYTFNFGIVTRYLASTSSSFPVLCLSSEADVDYSNKYCSSTGITSANSYNGADGTYTTYVTAGQQFKLRVIWGSGGATGALVRNGSYMSITAVEGIKGDNGDTGLGMSYGGEVTALDIDWTDSVFYKDISANSTFTFSNDTNGNIISIRLKADSTNRTVTFPIGILWPNGTSSTVVLANSSSVYTFMKTNDIITATFSDGLT